MNLNHKKDNNLTKIHSTMVFPNYHYPVIIKGLRMSRLPKGVCYEQQ